MWKDFFYFTKTERQGIIVLVVLIIGVFSIPRLVQLFSTPQEVTPEEDEKFKLEYDEFISSIKEIKPQRKFAEGDPPKNDSYSPKRSQALYIRSEHCRFHYFYLIGIAFVDS